jgi:hypothetical protein
MEFRIEGYVAVSEVDARSGQVLGVIVEVREVTPIDDAARAVNPDELRDRARRALARRLSNRER